MFSTKNTACLCLHHLRVIIAICLLPFALHSQSAKAYFRAGEKSFAQKDFGAAANYFQTVLANDAENLAARWHYAESMTQLYAYPEAEKAYLKIAAAKNGREKFPLLDLRLGEVRRLQGKYAEAAADFEKFLAEKPADASTADLEKAQNGLENCQFAQKLTAAPPKLTVTHLGKEVNSPFSDFAPVVRGDTLFFSSYKFDKKGDRSQPKGKLTRMQMSLKNGRARDIGRNFPVLDSVHVANGALTRDGHFFFFTECKNLNANDIRCELYLTVKTKRGTWSKPQRLPDGVNAKNATTTHPSIGFDSVSRRQVLWFASDRPSGLGKLDLWSVPLDSAWFCPCITDKFGGKKDPPLPKFEEPKNAAALNSSENDATPFFHAPTQTLFFSSDGRPGMGGYDLFSAKKLPADGQFSEPENLGAGFNSSYNDLYPALRTDGRSGYFASNRPGVYYLDETSKACCHDIFSFQIPPPEPQKPPGGEQPLAGKPTDPLPTKPALPTEPAPTPPLKFDPPKLADFVGLPLYFDNDEPDKRTRRTTTKKTYEETVQAYLEREETYREQFAAGLSGEKKDGAEAAIEAWFEAEVRRGYDRLFQLTDLIYSRLQADESVEVIIKGFTSPRAQTDYNLNLGKRRISSVRNHFEAYSDGVLRPFIQSGKFKISEASFGETTVRAGISDDLADERNSVYHPDAARERRVEIVEIRN